MMSFSLGLSPVLLAQGSSRLVYAFVDVSVVPMDTERVREHQTVITEGDRTIIIGRRDSVQIPADAIQIDGLGKYLMPGLTDPHVHVWHAEKYLLFVANGVTTVRVMAGDPRHFVIRERVMRGEVVGPSMYIAGPPINGAEPSWALAETPADGRKIVAEQKATAYEFALMSETAPDINLPWEGGWVDS